MGGILSMFGGAPKMPALPKAPVAPDVTKVAQHEERRFDYMQNRGWGGGWQDGGVSGGRKHIANVRMSRSIEKRRPEARDTVCGQF